MTGEKIKILVKEPYEEVKVIEILDELENLQKLVGGYIECIEHPKVKEVDIFFDEEGLYKYKDGNFYLPEYQDCVKGTCFMVSCDEDGELKSLTDDQIEKCKEYIKLYELKENENLYLNYDSIKERIMEIYDEQNEEEQS